MTEREQEDANDRSWIEVSIGICLNMTLFNLVKTSSKFESDKMFELMSYNLINQGLDPDLVKKATSQMKDSEKRMRELVW